MEGEEGTKAVGRGQDRICSKPCFLVRTSLSLLTLSFYLSLLTLSFYLSLLTVFLSVSPDSVFLSVSPDSVFLSVSPDSVFLSVSNVLLTNSSAKTTC